MLPLLILGITDFFPHHRNLIIFLIIILFIRVFVNYFPDLHKYYSHKTKNDYHSKKQGKILRQKYNNNTLEQANNKA